MDFFKIKEKTVKSRETGEEILEVYPDFIVGRSTDLMVRAKSFYAVWDEEVGLWSTDEYDVQRLVDEELRAYARRYSDQGVNVRIRSLRDFSSRSWLEFQRYIKNVSDSSHQLDESVTFQNTEVEKDDYVSKRLPYPLSPGSIDAYDELASTLYSPEERRKFEWAIGSIIAGDAKYIQKFLVFYGAAGSGKSTIMNIILRLFQGYYETFDAKALTGGANNFATEAFRTNPLVAIQQDGDLSRIEDNTKLNSIISHEEMLINEKNKPQYRSKINAFLFMGTNKPVRITDAKSGIIRRLIDVNPSGKRLDFNHYMILMSRIEFELGAIAHHCLEVYRLLGKAHYESYIPLDMLARTDVFYNFVEDNVLQFIRDNGVTLNRAYSMYKEYCSDALVQYPMAKYKFKDELMNYFKFFEERAYVEGERVRNWYSGFREEKFTRTQEVVPDQPINLIFDKEESLIDSMLKDCPAQYANDSGRPLKKWDDVTTTLKDLDTSREHFVRIPENHIVIDFDLPDEEEGARSAEANLMAAALWPPTYGEYSRSGAGVHLHYIYDGDATELSRVYGEGIEIKVFTGRSSLRRKLSRCNNVPVQNISSGLPKRKVKVIDKKVVQTEKNIRALIERNLRKEIHPGTKPSVDFIYKILEDAYESGSEFDVSDMRQDVLAFAMNSTNQADTAVKTVAKMHFQSDPEKAAPREPVEEGPIVFFDVEVYPNLFHISWKYRGKDQTIVRMTNPSPEEVGQLFEKRLVGYYCRRYDNHILYARYMGYDNKQLFDLSQKIIAGSKNAMFSEAYNISYTDIYDFASEKKSLKKWEIELGIHHKEMDIPWDQPVPDDRIEDVAAYCDNDVLASEAVFEARIDDFVARQILAEISGLSVNDTTNSHSAKIIFGDNRKPQSEFIYTDLSETFPGYSFDAGKSSYRGEDPGEGGYVYEEEGMYTDVALLDVASMHPTSIRVLNLFGKRYTDKFGELVDARVHIKHGDYDKAKQLFNGALGKYLTDPSRAKALSNALKIVINSVYGLTSANFDNPFRDIRNKDNIVAKRGALFMIDLKHFVQEQGFTVAHIKTDSIKIPNATPEIIEAVKEFGASYGYTFEHETTYEKMCLVNKAVYIAKDQDGWHATGAQFQHPFVFKTMFSKEPVELADLGEAKSVTTYLTLNFNEGLPDGTDDRVFVGRVGLFVPVKEGSGGGLLEREKDGKHYAATGTKGYRWKEFEVVKDLNLRDQIDMRYYSSLVDDAYSTIGKYGDAEWFCS